MEEELNENDLEQRFYAMIYYADDTQANVQENTKDEDTLQIFENAPRSTIRRYWRTSTDENVSNLKLNTPTDKSLINKSNVINTNAKTKTIENVSAPPKSMDLSVLQSPIPKDVKKTIEILDNDCGKVVELNSSDEDEVIEVALPPKPTITIESSDDEELKIISQQHSPIKEAKTIKKSNIKPGRRDRDVSASPVPSIVSSVSDEFIRGDCIALNISSRHPADHSFDFSLHGTDLLDNSTPSKKKKKKKSKDRVPSTPTDTTSTQNKSSNNQTDGCFATPKSKAKNKRQKNKSQLLQERIIASADLYDSDSNHSIDSKKSKNSYTVTEKSVPSSDVYESDSSQSETNKETTSNQSPPVKSNEVSVNAVLPKHTSMNNTPKSTPKNKDSISALDLNNMTNEWSDGFITIDETNIDENIVMANVTGFIESDNENEIIDIDIQKDVPKLGSTKVPAILNEDLDFDNLKGNSKVCRRRKYSLTALRAEMEKFYNESWGGENFNHREIQKYMSRDKSLWVIDPKDRMPSQYRKKSIICNYCNRPGHRDDMCQLKPPICYMCGSTGHYEPRCPRKICVNCGSPNYMYSTMCRNCATWARIKCAECGQYGHPASHCPDIWRRYHNTIDVDMPLEENRQTKNYHHLFCSGCTRRGHLVHTCRISLPFSGLPINTPYVHTYCPIYSPIPEEHGTNKNINPQQNENKQFKCSNQDSTHRTERNKRQSKSPIVHESHVIKKRNISEPTEEKSKTNDQLKKAVQNKEPNKDSVSELIDTTVDTDKAPDFIPISSSNHDKKGQIIQDNQVSDSNDVITSARIYVTKEVLDKLKTQEGEKWLSEMSNKYSVILQHIDLNLFLSVKGKVIDQETFQNELRNWTTEKSKRDNSKSENEANVLQESEKDAQSAMSNNIPKNRNNVLRKLTKALESLKQEIGDPDVLYKELTYLQNHHLQLLKQKVISPLQLSNNRDNIKEMLKKLNMILLGQAGLADGSKHLTELYSLKEKLTNFRQKTIPIDLRNEIGEHFHCIFTAIPRDDYTDLLNKYYVSTRKPAVMKKKENYRLRKPIQKKNFNSIPPQPKNLNNANDNEANNFVLNSSNFPQLCGSKPIVKKTMSKLVFYHQRLMHVRPVGVVHKKTRLQLVRRLHSYITSLKMNGTMRVKTLKKTKKILEQAQLLLTNV